jgi:hypothetical protein
VAVVVNDERDWVALAELGDELFVVPDGWVEVLRRLSPLTVKIKTRHIASIIPIHNAINIQHWNDMEYKDFSEIACLDGITEKIGYSAFAHVRSIRFSGMHARRYEDAGLHRVFLSCTWMRNS